MARQPDCFASVDRRALLLGAAAILVSRAAAAAPAQLPVRAADAFVDCVGVNVHLGSEPYASAFDHVRTLLGASGIRHVRDELRPGNDLARWRDLNDRFGIRSHLLVSPATNTIADMLQYLDTLGAHRVSAIEGQNEGDSDWFRSLPAIGGDWSMKVIDYQRAAYQALRSRYAADVLPMLSPSVLDWKPDDMTRIRGAAPFSDIVAIHSYVQHGQEPETPDNYASLNWYLTRMRDAFKPGAPVMATEAGYNNVTRPKGSGISEAAAAIYIPRLLLHNFEAGVQRTFLYEFMDGGVSLTDTEAHWGLLRHDGSAKPAYHAVRRLLAALKDDQTNLRDASLRVAMPSAPPDVRCQVFRKRDATVVVAVWRSLRCWNVETARDIATPPLPLDIAIEGPLAHAARMRPHTDEAWTEIAIGSGKISLPVGGHVVLLRLSA